LHSSKVFTSPVTRSAMGVPFAKVESMISKVAESLRWSGAIWQAFLLSARRLDAGLAVQTGNTTPVTRWHRVCDDPG
jgi:hypothetical protein